MTAELSKHYDPASIEGPIYRKWLEAKAFAALPDERENRFVVMMPLPNVTGALHMGHAMDNVMQDLLVRWHRMMGDNTLWMPGTDHAGIATQSVVEKRLKELEGKTRHDIGREELVRRIWEWKDEYQRRIVEQQQRMGCSCDWDRQRFTMDAVCSRAVRYAFFYMFRDGLIYRGDRMVNWDCELQTAVADDEVYHEEVQGHFWWLRYPVIDPEEGEPEYVVVATTRPETMLGDTAVVCHPEPGRALDEAIARTEERLARASAKERPELEAALRDVEERKRTLLPRLETIRRMAQEGRRVRLPLLDRPIPIVLDEWAKPEMGSGCVKATPAHDPNDYEVWRRHAEEMEIVNILEPDGSLNRNAGPFAGMDRFEARKAVVEALEQAGLIEKVEDRKIEIAHSDRSKTPIEPYLSRQWFVRMGDVEGGVVMGRGTPKEHVAPGLAQAAIDAAREDWRSPSGLNVSFHPERYRATYTNWLAEKRDWCISRQLWWGHRIPVWLGAMSAARLAEHEGILRDHEQRDDVAAWAVLPDGRRMSPAETLEWLAGAPDPDTEVEVQICFLHPDADERMEALLHMAGFHREEDVLDTWFSSALWPHSTLGWPDPETAPVDPGQTPLGSFDGRPDALGYYYPGSCLVTARDIITLWVARMVIMGLYDMGDVPFTDVFIHANIQDGKGVKMSKSKGNGIDPIDIIDKYGADAMRYVICDLQTGTQDVRLPVVAVSPYTGKVVDLATAKHGRSIFTYVCPDTGKEFDVLGTLKDVPQAKVYSERFEVGRNFCNKLWNAGRFVLGNLEGAEHRPTRVQDLELEDRWILSRLAAAVEDVHGQLESYAPSAALAAARELFWSELCDWYLELVKARLRDPERAATARQVLAAVFDQVLRLLHPFVPFITEALWQRLREVAPRRGVDDLLPADELLVTAAWPRPRPSWRDPDLEADFDLYRDVVTAIRELRARYSVPPSRSVRVEVTATGRSAEVLEAFGDLVARAAGVESLEIGPDDRRRPAAGTSVVRDVEVHLLDAVDPEKERRKLVKQRAKLEARIQASRAKLANEQFLAKAPSEVVERERAQLAELEAQLARLADVPD